MKKFAEIPFSRAKLWIAGLVEDALMSDDSDELILREAQDKFIFLRAPRSLKLNSISRG